jgi:tetratricopeptide (TPR) repeat protein
MGILAILAAVGCGPEFRARQSLDAGQPEEAVRLFSEAVEKKPDDPSLRVELAGAQRQAAATLALEAEQAIAEGRLDEAANLARRATQFDPAFETLRQRAGEAQVRALLTHARAELEAGRYDGARAAARRAATIAPNDQDVLLEAHRIDGEEADALATEALDLAAAGDMAGSRRLADRAVQLAPGRASTQDLLPTIDRIGREARFDALAVSAQRQLEARTLTAAAESIARLGALGVRRERLENLQVNLRERQDALQSALLDARARRAAGDLDQALRAYDTASALVADRPDVSAERKGCEADLRFESLVRDATLAMERGAHDDALESYRAALAIRADEATADRLRQAEAASWRRRLQASLDAEDLLDAVRSLAALLRVAPDAAAEERLARLRRDLVEVTLSDASSRDAAGRPDEAIDLVTQALVVHADPALEERLLALRVRWLLEQATEADRLGRFREARDLYLEAMALDRDQPGIAARVSDIQPAAALQERAEKAEADAADLARRAESLALDLATRDRKVNSLLNDLRESESSISDLDRANHELTYEVNELQRLRSHLEHEVYTIKCDKDRLRSALHRAKRDADEWRRRYERERRRGGR